MVSDSEDVLPGADRSLLLQFSPVNCAAFAVFQIVIARAPGISNWGFKLFQWDFFVLTALLIWMNLY